MMGSQRKLGRIGMAFLVCAAILCSQWPTTARAPGRVDTIPWTKLRAEAQVLGKPYWRPMLAFLAELHERGTHPAQPPFPYPWEDLGPGYPRRAFGHWDIVHEVLDVMPALPKHARNQILNDLANQPPDGLVPGSIYMDGKPDAGGNVARFGRKAGHPPLWPLAVHEFSKMTGNNGLIAQCYEPLIRQIAWFERNRRAGAGFFYSRTQWESGLDDDLRERFARTGTIWEFYHPQGGRPEDLKREVEPPRGLPHRDYLGHNPLFAMARLCDQLASRLSSQRPPAKLAKP